MPGTLTAYLLKKWIYRNYLMFKKSILCKHFFKSILNGSWRYEWLRRSVKAWSCSEVWSPPQLGAHSTCYVPGFVLKTTFMHTIHLHNNPMIQLLWFTPLYACGNWGTERSGCLPKVTQPTTWKSPCSLPLVLEVPAAGGDAWETPRGPGAPRGQATTTVLRVGGADTEWDRGSWVGSPHMDASVHL